jgi:hypothetical protein
MALAGWAGDGAGIGRFTARLDAASERPVLERLPRLEDDFIDYRLDEVRQIISH